MYAPLTTTELTALQETLFAAVEQAYWVINVNDGDPESMRRYHPLHRELGEVFIGRAGGLTGPGRRPAGLSRPAPTASWRGRTRSARAGRCAAGGG